MSLSLSQLYPGSGVELDCIDSLFLHPFLLRSQQTSVKKGSRKNLSGISKLVLKDILGTKKEWKIKFNIDLSILNKYVLIIKKLQNESCDLHSSYLLDLFI